LFMPAIFFYIDARYQTWYRRVTLREREIARFLNSRPWQLPRELLDITFESDFETERHTFPIYDLDASYTFARDNSYAWETSLSRQFLDSTPLSIYGSQLIASGLIAWVKINPVRVAGVKIDGSYAFFAAVLQL